MSCDYLACGFHLVPNVELAELLGCKVDDGAVRVDEFQQTSVSDVYCAGESTGIGGLELSMVEGEIAGLAVAGNTKKRANYFRFVTKQRKFAELLNRTFALRDELKKLVQPETIVCRCEDVTYDRCARMAPGVRQSCRRAVVWDHARVEFVVERLSFYLVGGGSVCRQCFQCELKV